MASITQLKDGTWQYRVSYKKTNGQYSTKSKKGFSNRKKCEREAFLLEESLREGVKIDADFIIFTEYFMEWYETYKKGNVAKSTQKNYEMTQRILNEHFKNINIKNITEMSYQKFINIYADKYSHEVISKIHTHSKNCLERAVKDGILRYNPAKDATVKGNDFRKGRLKKRAICLDKDEQIKLITYVLNIEYKDAADYLILLTLGTGIRFEEALGLTWDCVNFKNNSISIVKSYDYKFTKKFAPLKTPESERTLPISQELVNLLKDLRKKQLKYKRYFKNIVFISDRGLDTISNTAFNNRLKKYCRTLNIKEVTHHKLRHSHLSLLIYEKVATTYISLRAGHTNISTTLDKYSHVIKEMERAESQKIVEISEAIFQCKMNAK